jgi:hypothetical protein
MKFVANLGSPLSVTGVIAEFEPTRALLCYLTQLCYAKLKLFENTNRELALGSVVGINLLKATVTSS